ncbi:quinone oxidoreductase family protein [Nocardia terpenica]|uniref:Zinc-binding dehydrogenase n=1 Tax=Nocardia terpenica TaxID=455432 RepID=A0A6G9Z958_9NOCA|nr:zinc-binding dehydrogenase [Nocardia terpenica]QIS21887.1 zinc-binding dehydrogenase [Nocardia terpenica]
MYKIRFSAPPDLVEDPRPTPGPGQVLIRTELAGIHLGLVRMVRAGTAEEPGGEVVGTVVAVGPEVPESWLGARVGGVVMSGAYAEYVLGVPALLTEIPAGVAAADALAVVRGGLVALGALRAGRFAAGESILVTGAASGSGHLAMQIARALGASRVLAAAGSADKAAFLRDCGADAVVTYTENWGEPVDVVLDGVGGDLLARGVATLNPHGRLVAYSAGGGAVEANSLLPELKTVTGFSVGLLARSEPEVIAEYRTELWKLLGDGGIRPRVTVFPAVEVGPALGLVAERRNLGRVALRTSEFQ